MADVTSRQASVPPSLPRIVIIGCGFGGLAAAHALKDTPALVTVVDKTNHHLFQPLLYQVATAALAPTDIATATRALLRNHRNTDVLMAEVTGIDPELERITFAHRRSLEYDYLIIATGAAYSFFGNDRFEQYVKVLKTVDDASAIRTHVLGSFEAAEQTMDPEILRRLLTFVIVGSGPTGVELAGAIAELTRTTLACDFRWIRPQDVHIILCESGDRLLAGFDPELSDYAGKALADLGVEIKLKTRVSDIDAATVSFGEERIPSLNVFWCAGTKASPAAQWLAVPAARNGAIQVLEDCSVPGHPNIFAIGDVASYQSTNGKPLPGLAAVAKQHGRYVGRLLDARITSSDPVARSFRYRDYGSLAVIGRSRAVAEIFGHKLKGRLAWVIWSLVHLMLLVDLRSRLSVYLNWTWSWLTYGRGARLLTGTEVKQAVPRFFAGIGSDRNRSRA
jgi:NADH dehydrogenase